MAQRPQPKAAWSIYAILIGGIAWQVAAVALSHVSPTFFKSHTVYVAGDVDRPGRYRVVPGTTEYEILKVAGVRPTSNLMDVNLMRQITQNDTLVVTKGKVPQFKQSSPFSVRLGTSYGDVSIVAPDGRTRQLVEEMSLVPGDRVITESQTQAEISINENSRIAVDNFSEVAIDRISMLHDTTRIVGLSQRSGICWYRMVYSGVSERYTITTPQCQVVVGGNNAEFVVDVKYNDVSIHVVDGLLLVERPSTGEAINLITNQSATYFADGRPTQVRGISMDIAPSERFASLIKEKSTKSVKGGPFNFIFFGVPGSYFFINVNYDKLRISVVNIPSELVIENFVDDMTTLDQAVLQAGPAFAATIIERMLDIKVEKYLMFGIDDVLRAASAIGDVSVEVDDKAAAFLRISPGYQRLQGAKLMQYMSPGPSGWDGARDRQISVLRAIFDKIASKTLMLSAIIIGQVFGGSETNISVNDAIGEYSKFSGNKNWVFKKVVLPVTEVAQKGRTVKQPILDKCKTVLTEGQ